MAGTRVSDSDIARVAVEAHIEQADLAPQRLRQWLEGMLANYSGNKEVYAGLPPPAPQRMRVYRDLATRVDAVRQVLKDNPWLVGDMIDWEISRLETRRGADDRIERIVTTAGRRVQRDVHALGLLERRAIAERESGGRRHREETRPVGRANPAVDDLTSNIFTFWHYALRRSILNEKGGVAIGGADAPSRLVRFACAVYRLAEGEGWSDPSARFETLRGRLKLRLAHTVMGTAPRLQHTSDAPPVWRERFMRRLIKLGFDPDSAREAVTCRSDFSSDPEEAAEEERRGRDNAALVAGLLIGVPMHPDDQLRLHIALRPQGRG
jgi:hypothetical protein